jgi:capsular polysaccharide biosynthesis protein
VELQEYLQILRKRWLLIFIITITAALVSAFVSFFIVKPAYKSDISVIIGKIGTDTAAGNQAADYNDLRFYQMLVKTYSELAKSRTVAEDVINKLSLDIVPEEVRSMISVSTTEDTEFLNIEVRSKDAKQAMLIANQLAASLKEVSITIKKMDNVQILDSAQLPMGPFSPKPLLNTVVAFSLGLMVSVGLAFLLEFLDNTVKTEEDIGKLIGVPVIGVIPSEAEVK